MNKQPTDASATSVITTGFVADSYHDAPKMADLLLANGQLIAHLEKIPKAERIRLLDFISGVMYAFDGAVQKNWTSHAPLYCAKKWLRRRSYYNIINKIMS